MSVSSSGSVRKCKNQRTWKLRVAGLPASVAPLSTLLSSTPARSSSGSGNHSTSSSIASEQLSISTSMQHVSFECAEVSSVQAVIHPDGCVSGVADVRVCIWLASGSVDMCCPTYKAAPFMTDIHVATAGKQCNYQLPRSLGPETALPACS